MTRATSLSKLIVLTIALAVVVTIPASGAKRSWKGTDGTATQKRLMTRNGNWVGVRPVGGDNIEFNASSTGSGAPNMNDDFLTERIVMAANCPKDITITGNVANDLRLRSMSGKSLRNLDTHTLYLNISGTLRQDNDIQGTTTNASEVTWESTGGGLLRVSPGTLTLECDLLLHSTGSSIITIDTALTPYGTTTNWDITKTGNGTLNLKGNSTVDGVYSFEGGLTVLNGGGTHTVNGNAVVDGSSTELRVAVADEILDTKNVTLANGGTLNLQSFDETINKLILQTGGLVSGTTGILTSTANVDAQSGTIGAILGGAGGLDKTTAGTVTLSAVNTYTGDTTVSAGELNVTGALLDSDITVIAGAMLSGNGTVGTVDVFGTIAPGLSPGTMAAGTTTWNDGGDFEFEIDDTAGSAGADPGWDLLDITGTLELSGLTDDGFEIDIISLIHADHTSGDAANFNSATSYAWEFVSTSGGITGFDADDFVLDDSLFTNDLNGGAFSVEQNGNSLEIVFTAIPEPGTMAILGLGGVGVLLRRRRRKIAA